MKHIEQLLVDGEKAFHNGAFEDAERQLRQAIDELDAAGKHNLAKAEAMNNLAATYRAQEKDNMAEPLLMGLVPLSEKVIGSNHPDLSVVLNNLASFYVDQNKNSMAEPVYERALALLREHAPKTHPCWEPVLTGLASVYRFGGRDEDAEKLEKQAEEHVS